MDILDQPQRYDMRGGGLVGELVARQTSSPIRKDVDRIEEIAFVICKPT